ncbi:MAG TPA: carboxypeptidase-like regulatory domain-containing protein [Acidobacteriaceae bacterium]|nr:carboxypeptidase-like regulatory domain-containing protein [Acidobacteriaceae bacterium]
MRKITLQLASLIAVLMLVAAPTLRAQGTGKVHGHVQDPLGIAMANVQVKLNSNGQAKYTFTTDANGDYKGDNVAPGSYDFTLYNAQNKTIDQFQDVKVTAGGDTAQDFDLSRAAYIAKMSPEQKKQLEAAKSANSKISAENVKIKNLNADLVQARKDTDAKNYAAADALMTRDTTAKPDAAVLWVALGKAQLGEKKYPEAATSLQKAVDADKADKKQHPDIQAAADNSLGEALADQGKVPEAQAAYDAAATVDPKGAGMYYGNEAIMMDRLNNVDATVAAADKAIAADPNKPIPYYLKGKSLITKATVDPKTQKIIAPPGTEEAYQKYLDLAPNGPFAPDAKAILAQLGTKEQTSYHKGKH